MTTTASDWLRSLGLWPEGAKSEPTQTQPPHPDPWPARLKICRACEQYMDGGGYIDGCQLAPGDCCAHHDIRRHGKCEMGKW